MYEDSAVSSQHQAIGACWKGPTPKAVYIMTAGKGSQIGYEEQIEEQLNVGRFLIMLELWVVEQRLISSLYRCFLHMQIRLVFLPLAFELAQQLHIVPDFRVIQSDSAITGLDGSCCLARIPPQQREMNTERAIKMNTIIKYRGHKRVRSCWERQIRNCVSVQEQHYIFP